MARPTKYEKERCDKILHALRAGCTRKAASSAGGIDFQTFLNWLSRYSGFSTDVEIAENDAEREFTLTVANAAGQGDARMAIEWLKRRRRDDWGDSVKQDTSIKTERLVQDLTENEIDNLIASHTANRAAL